MFYDSGDGIVKDLQRAAHLFRIGTSSSSAAANAAIVAALTAEMGLCVDMFAPGASRRQTVSMVTLFEFSMRSTAEAGSCEHCRLHVGGAMCIIPRRQRMRWLLRAFFKVVQTPVLCERR